MPLPALWGSPLNGRVTAIEAPAFLADQPEAFQIHHALCADGTEQLEVPGDASLEIARTNADITDHGRGPPAGPAIIVRRLNLRQPLRREV